MHPGSDTLMIFWTRFAISTWIFAFSMTISFPRQKPHRFKQCGFPNSRENQRLLKRRQTKPLHRSFRASLHSHGGAPYAVTHSRRKYHHTRMCILARSPAWDCFAALVWFAPSPDRGPPGAPAVRLRTCGTYLIALFRCPFPRMLPHRCRIKPFGSQPLFLC